MHVPQWSVSCGASYASSTSVSRTPRKNQLPHSRFNSSVFLPIQPRPASCANSRSEQRGRIDDAAHLRLGPMPPHGRGQRVQPVVQHVVIVGPPGIARDAAVAGLDRGRFRRAVALPEHDEAANPFQDVPRMGIGLAAVGEVLHLAGESGVEPLVEAGITGRLDRRADADEAEA